jgi:hypothetical protein
MKTIILIPYRNRANHLKYFLENSVPKLKETIDNLEILIIEQSNDGKLFNRGKVLNIGFKYYDNDDYYYITQDVDTNPIHEDSLNQYKKDLPNYFYRIYSSAAGTLGGIIKFKGNIFREINGFPNDYWGWGLEDNVLWHRAKMLDKLGNINKNKFILTKNGRKNVLFKVFEQPKKNRSKNFNLKKKRTLMNKNTSEEKNNYVLNSGLNNLEFKILKEENLDTCIKKIVVEI